MTNFLRKSKRISKKQKDLAKGFGPLNEKELEFLKEVTPQAPLSEADYKKMLEMIQKRNSKFMKP